MWKIRSLNKRKNAIADTTNKLTLIPTIQVHRGWFLPSGLSERFLPSIVTNAPTVKDYHPNQIEEDGHHQRHKPVVVQFSDAKIDEAAVVVESLDAPVALHAVLRFLDNVPQAVLTVAHFSFLPRSR